MRHRIHGEWEARCEELVYGLHDHCSLHGLCRHSRMSDELLDCSTAAGLVVEVELDRGMAEGRRKEPAACIAPGDKAEEHSWDGSLRQTAEQEHADEHDVLGHGCAPESTAAEELDSYSPAGGSCHTELRVGQDMAAQCIRNVAARCGSRPDLRGNGRPYDCLSRRLDSGRRESNSTVRSWRRQR